MSIPIMKDYGQKEEQQREQMKLMCTAEPTKDIIMA